MLKLVFSSSVDEIFTQEVENNSLLCNIAAVDRKHIIIKDNISEKDIDRNRNIRQSNIV